MADFFIGGVGPSVIGFSADADDSPMIEPGPGATVLLAPVLVTPAQTVSLIAKLYAASGRTHAQTPGLGLPRGGPGTAAPTGAPVAGGALGDYSGGGGYTLPTGARVYK